MGTSGNWNSHLALTSVFEDLNNYAADKRRKVLVPFSACFQVFSGGNFWDCLGVGWPLHGRV